MNHMMHPVEREKVMATQPGTSPATGSGKADRKRPFFLEPWVWRLAGGFAVLLVIVAISIPNLLRS